MKSLGRVVIQRDQQPYEERQRDGPPRRRPCDDGHTHGRVAATSPEGRSTSRGSSPPALGRPLRPDLRPPALGTKAPPWSKLFPSCSSAPAASGKSCSRPRIVSVPAPGRPGQERWHSLPTDLRSQPRLGTQGASPGAGPAGPPQRAAAQGRRPAERRVLSFALSVTTGLGVFPQPVPALRASGREVSGWGTWASQRLSIPSVPADCSRAHQTDCACGCRPRTGEPPPARVSRWFLRGSGTWTSGPEEFIKGCNVYTPSLQRLHPGTVTGPVPGAPASPAAPPIPAGQGWLLVGQMAAREWGQPSTQAPPP